MTASKTTKDTKNEARILSTSDSAPLSQLVSVINSIKITARWALHANLKTPPEADIFLFARDKNGIAPRNEDFVFFNQMENDDASTLLTPVLMSEDAHGAVMGEQSAIIHLNKIRYEITDLLLGFNVYRATERDQSLRFMDSLQFDISLVDEQTPFLSYTIAPADHKTCVCLASMRLERDGNDWIIHAAADEFASFNDAARAHGIVVSA